MLDEIGVIARSQEAKDLHGVWVTYLKAKQASPTCASVVGVVIIFFMSVILFIEARIHECGI